MTAGSETPPDKTLDVRGDICPRPRLLAMMALDKLDVGQVLRVIGDHAPSLGNIRSDAAENGHTILKANMVGEVEWEILVRREA